MGDRVMVPQFITLKTYGMIPPPSIRLRRKMNKWMKRSYKEMGGHWHRYMMNKHFTWEGFLEYKYRKRRSYKFREPGKNPLVKSGETKKGLQARRISSQPSYVRIRLKAPKLNRAPWMRAELVTVSKGEMRDLAKVFDKRFGKMLKAENDRTTERIR